MNCELMLTYDTPAYRFNVNKNHPSRQTGSRNPTGPKTLPTIWHTYMKLVTKYQISAINSCWEKCDEKYLGWMEGQKEVKQYTLPPVERGYNNVEFLKDGSRNNHMGGLTGSSFFFIWVVGWGSIKYVLVVGWSQIQ